MNAYLELLKLRVDVAKLKMAIALPQGKALNPDYRNAESELHDAEKDLEKYINGNTQV